VTQAIEIRTRADVAHKFRLTLDQLLPASHRLLRTKHGAVSSVTIEPPVSLDDAGFLLVHVVYGSGKASNVAHCTYVLSIRGKRF